MRTLAAVLTAHYLAAFTALGMPVFMSIITTAVRCGSTLNAPGSASIVMLDIAHSSLFRRSDASGPDHQ